MAPERSQLLARLVLDAWRQSPFLPELWLVNTCTTPDQLATARTLTRAATALGALGNLTKQQRRVQASLEL